MKHIDYKHSLFALFATFSCTMALCASDAETPGATSLSSPIAASAAAVSLPTPVMPITPDVTGRGMGGGRSESGNSERSHHGHGRRSAAGTGGSRRVRMSTPLPQEPYRIHHNQEPAFFAVPYAITVSHPQPTKLELLLVAVGTALPVTLGVLTAAYIIERANRPSKTNIIQTRLQKLRNEQAGIKSALRESLRDNERIDSQIKEETALLQAAKTQQERETITKRITALQGAKAQNVQTRDFLFKAEKKNQEAARNDRTRLVALLGQQAA